ncbi:type II toxin-antitoxin system PemK/MazF family toxin [Rhodococcus sp. NPDC049939]|uniref:type II toxin-antitoxin system PemK/MazF family toxin n=1 Tax=Rhodococcus sp. NPDC049939 TaxID=3155511 RepID=UPI0033C23106
MASTWSGFGKTIGRIVRDKGPELLQRLQKSGAVDRVAGVLTGSGPAPKTTPGRPVSSNAAPTAHRARKVEYSPDLDGRADPGEIVWTWTTYEEDPSQGKDRPVLVVGRDGDTLLGLMLSSQSRHEGDQDWIAIGSGSWDSRGRPSWIRLDRVLDVPEAGIRREGAIMDRDKFEAVAKRLRTDFSWR